jgi:hypothetical protein
MKGIRYLPGDNVFDVDGEVVRQVVRDVAERDDGGAVVLRVRAQRRLQRLQHLREDLRALLRHVHEQASAHIHVISLEHIYSSLNIKNSYSWETTL